MWTVLIDGEAGWFPSYSSRAIARAVAAAYRGYWRRHRYSVVRDRWI